MLNDEFFLGMAKYMCCASKDPSTKCGAVIVRPDRTVASVGFNGFPKHSSDDPELYENRETKYARIVHAEMNAILHAREDLTGYTIYTHQIPLIGPSCDRCTAHIIQAGIIRVVSYTHPETPERWRESIAQAQAMYKDAGVEVVSLPSRLQANL